MADSCAGPKVAENKRQESANVAWFSCWLQSASGLQTTRSSASETRQFHQFRIPHSAATDSVAATVPCSFHLRNGVEFVFITNRGEILSGCFQDSFRTVDLWTESLRILRGFFCVWVCEGVCPRVSLGFLQDSCGVAVWWIIAKILSAPGGFFLGFSSGFFWIRASSLECIIQHKL